MKYTRQYLLPVRSSFFLSYKNGFGGNRIKLAKAGLDAQTVEINRRGAELSREAAGDEVEEGSVGAGTGATVGKALGLEGAMKGGVGTWAERRGELVVGALAVVNAFGDVRDESGAIIAGARREGAFVDARAFLADGGAAGGSFARPGANTTLVVVATNARLERAELAEVAAMAVDALAQRITPVGTQYDGDIVFAVSTSELEGQGPLGVELLGQRAVATAVERAVRTAKGMGVVPGLAD